MRPSSAAANSTRLCQLALAFSLAALTTAGFAATPFTYLVSGSTAFSGTGLARVTDLVVDVNGNSFVTGVIGSYNFPGINSAAVTNAGIDLRFVARIDALSRTPAFVSIVGSPTSSLTDARYGTFGKDEVQGLAVDKSGNSYVVAYDAPTDYPVSGGQYRASSTTKHLYKIDSTGHVSRLSPSLDAAIRRIGAIALDASGNLYLTGSAGPGLNTSAGAPYPQSSVTADCGAPFVMKLDATGQFTLYATYLSYAGTNGFNCAPGDTDRLLLGNPYLGVTHAPTGFAIAVDAAGSAYVTGQAEPGLQSTAGSPSAPTALEFDQQVALHAFVVKLNAAGTQIVYTARLGGNGADRGTSIAIDSTGAAYIGGKSTSTDFGAAALATTGLTYPFDPRQCFAFDPSGYFSRKPEAGFVAKISPDGKQWLLSGMLPSFGGQLDNCAQLQTPEFAPVRIALDPLGNIYAVGQTNDYYLDFPSTHFSFNAMQSSAGNWFFVVHTPQGVAKYVSLLTGSAGAPSGLAIDHWGTVVIAGAGADLKRISPGVVPVDIAVTPSPACAVQPASLTALVAASNDLGTVDFQVDDVSVGSASIVNGIAAKSVSLAVGIRKLVATYHGPGSFDGYSSAIGHVAVNQSGACQ